MYIRLFYNNKHVTFSLLFSKNIRLKGQNNPQKSRILSTMSFGVHKIPATRQAYPRRIKSRLFTRTDIGL